MSAAIAPCRHGSAFAAPLWLVAAALAAPLGAQPAHEHAAPASAQHAHDAAADLAEHSTTQHLMLEDPLNRLIRVDRLEAGGDGDSAWDLDAWVGHDLNKLWIRSEGERDDSATQTAEIDVLWAHSFARWWDFVTGARQDFGAGPDETWAVLGVQGIAPYRFDVEATAFVADGSRVSARIEAQYDLLITNRLVLQPLVEAEWNSESDAARQVGSGLASAEAGLRLRYEIRREIAPYLGLVRRKLFGGTADIARANDFDTDDTELVAGIRLWF